LADPDVDAILCARGGYGATRLLPRLVPEAVAAAAKPVVGFSDITALHALWARAGVRSYHAGMVANLGRADEPVREAWAAALEGALDPPSWPVEELVAGETTGRLTGGNLAVLVALLGTPFVPPLDGAILFLEDVGERPYRIDRMLTQLTQAGWFSRCAGVALGAFTEGAPGPDGACLADVLDERLGKLGIPVVSGIPSGHVAENATLPFGACAKIASCQLKILPD
jgi:muramoyltetrapeptide carboxypeptidase